jgi:beta-glucanase (GH16 family)
MHIKTVLLNVVFIFLTGLSVHSEVVWSDEFNGTAIDTDIWTWDVGGGGFGNGQLEHNTARSENSYIENGSLVLEARRESYSGNEFTSARINTQGRFAFKYGTLEARIQLPDTANGLWPAFWMLGNNFPGIVWPNCGEIDILESGADAGIQNGTQNELINSALHFSDAGGNYQSYAQWINASDYIASDDLSADYHRYKVEWTPTDLTFYIDDVQFATWDISAEHFAEYHQPHFPILNVAIGGWNYVKITDPNLITASFPAQMKVDWIRLEDNGYTEVFLGEYTAETGNFGIFTETAPMDTALIFGDDTTPEWPYSRQAALYLWESFGAPTMAFSATPAVPSEGAEVWTFDIGAVPWCGMGVLLPNFRNMANYSDGFLHFDIQTTSPDTFEVGLESARGKQSWLPLGDESAEYGFVRDGNWHSITVPLNRFGNADFNTINQIFMLLCSEVTASATVSIDNIWWEPSVARPMPAGGSFGVYTETGANKTAGEFELGVDGDFFVWANTLNPAAQDPYEGGESLSFQSAPALSWFGAAFTPNVKYNLEAFDNPNGKLSFAMKTSSTVSFRVGMKSGNLEGVGQKWFNFDSGSDPYGFARDGQWHVIEIPVADFTADVDLSQMSQLFQILGTAGPIDDIELDDIYYLGGLANETNVVSVSIQRGVGISWPSTDGSTYTVQWTSDLSTNGWNSLGPAIEGDWTTKTLFDPFGTHSNRFYQVLELP